MLIVSLDTSSQVSSVAVLSEERVAAEVSMQGALTHSETLMPHIELALQMARAKKTELDGIAVSIGPGSFTGLRIGLAAAKMMAYALNIPMICVPTLEALACHYAGSVGLRILPMMDAQKGNVYVQEFRWRPEGEDVRLSEEHPLSILPLAEVLDALVGTELPAVLLGDATRRNDFPALPADVGIAPLHLRMPRAACVGLAGLARLQRGEKDDPVTAVPLYLRRSEAEVLWEQRHGGAAAS